MTMYTPDIRAIADELRRECDEDYVGMWQVARSLEDEQITGGATVDLIVEVARHVLTDGTICIGQFHSGVFEPWAGDGTVQLERLRSELHALGRVPDIGEIGWFAAL